MKNKQQKPPIPFTTKSFEEQATRYLSTVLLASHLPLHSLQTDFLEIISSLHAHKPNGILVLLFTRSVSWATGTSWVPGTRLTHRGGHGLSHSASVCVLILAPPMCQALCSAGPGAQPAPGVFTGHHSSSKHGQRDLENPPDGHLTSARGRLKPSLRKWHLSLV